MFHTFLREISRNRRYLSKITCRCEVSSFASNCDFRYVRVVDIKSCYNVKFQSPLLLEYRTIKMETIRKASKPIAVSAISDVLCHLI